MDRSPSLRRLGCAVAALLLPLASCAADDASAGPPGGGAEARGHGDPLFPDLGDRGYDVGHYGLALDYDVRRGRLSGTARITATARHDLASYTLDLRGLRVRSVEVDGRRARFSRSGHKLTVRPGQPPRRGGSFVTTVRYDGAPHSITDADGSVEGWVRTGDGAFVAGQPAGAMTWFPCNNLPWDKATYDIDVTVPKGYTGVSNGVLAEQRTRGGRTTFRWRHSDPMATYLATATVGKFKVTRGRAHGIPLYTAVDPTLAGAADPVLRRLPDVLAWETRLFGRYPFAAAGSIVDDAPRAAGYALETQTRPLYAEAPDVRTVVHEMAHQWFGDAVTPRTWQDIWLNEGFATYAEWLWDAHEGGPSVQQSFEEQYRKPPDSPVWAFPPGRPTAPREVLGPPVYQRGAMVLQELRRAVGDRAFFRILREWPAAHRYGDATSRDFASFCRARTGKDLSPVFDTWLYGKGKPAAR